MVTTTADSGPGSLRDAINQINADTSHTLHASPSNPSVDEIDFGISTGAGYNSTTGVATIQPLSELPLITNAVVIDGYTQSGASRNPVTVTIGDNAVLNVVLDSSLIPNPMAADGLQIAGGNSTVEGLQIQSFSGNIVLWSNNNVVAGNSLQSNSPDGNGVLIDGSSNTIGGTTPAARNVISATFYGVAVGGFGDPCSGDVVEGNYIGTNAAGTAALAPVVHGPGFQVPTGIVTFPEATNTLIANNLISGWGTGVMLNGTGHQLQGNLIGTDATGTQPIPNGIGVAAFGTNMTIGGTTPGAGNTIAFNDGPAVSVAGTGVQIEGRNSIYGNKDLNGTTGQAIDNLSQDLFTGNPGPGLVELNWPGGPFTGTNNATFSDLMLTETGSTLTYSGTLNGLANTRYMVYFDASPDDGISGYGFYLAYLTTDATGQVAFTNLSFPAPPDFPSIPGSIPVDATAWSPHSLGNYEQNYPVLTSVTSSASGTTVTGSLNGQADTTFRVEFFANPAPDTTGYGQGQTYLGFANVTTDDTGNVTFPASLAAANLAGQWLTATATDLPNATLGTTGGNTSQFSAAVPILAAGETFAQFLQAGLPQRSTTANSLTIVAGPSTTPATVLAAMNGLSSVMQPVTIVLDLGSETFPTDGVPANPPGSVTLVIQNGTLTGGLQTNGNVQLINVTLDPDHPALTVAGGQVSAVGCTLTTSGNAPTILVEGGHLTLRNDIMQESTAGNEAAISITGGTVDLGTATSPGGNTINVNGAGSFVNNGTANPVPTNDDTFEINGNTLAGPTLSFSGLTSAQLVFTAAPTSTFAGFPLNSPGGVQVAVEDQLGDVVTGDTSTVTVAISSGPPGGAFLSSSATVAQAHNGVATFPNLAVNLAGTYTLKATDGALTVATATVVIQPNTGILLLDPTRQSLTVSGNAKLNVTNYGAIVIDSSNSAAVSASGNASVTATEIDVHGGLAASSLTAIHGATNQGAAALADPLAILAAPSQPSTQFTAVNYSGTLQPGTYVGGITVSGSNSVTLQPGLYYLKGGGLTVSGSASVTGTGVMLYLTGINSTSVNISGNASVTLTPPTSGPYQGIVLFQDRTSSAAITISGKGALNTTGTEYAPGATVTLSGTSDTDDPTHTSLGAEWIVDDLVLSGNAQFTISANANNRSQNPNAFLVAGGPVQPAVSVTFLTAAEAEAAVKAAVALWGGAGVDAGTLQGLSRAAVTIAPLPAPYLGLAAPDAIYLDPTAQGYGWFTDTAVTGAPPTNQVDLVTVVAHELGHLFGLMDGDGTALMVSTLAPGLRILPDAADLLAPHMTLAAPARTAAPTAADNAAARAEAGAGTRENARLEDQAGPAPLLLQNAAPSQEGAATTDVSTDRPAVPLGVEVAWVSSGQPTMLHEEHDVGFIMSTAPAGGDHIVQVASVHRDALVEGQGRSLLIAGLDSLRLADDPLPSAQTAHRTHARTELSGSEEVLGRATRAGRYATAVATLFQAEPLDDGTWWSDREANPGRMLDRCPELAAECPLVERPRQGAAGSLTLEELAAAGAVVFGLLGAAWNEPPATQDSVRRRLSLG
jgi:hypothetical protein